MTTLLILLAASLLTVALVAYVRHDHFAGAGSVADRLDDLGSTLLRNRVVPRR